MGKRELVILAAFFAVGLAAWRIAAPASADPSRGFSLERIAGLWRAHGPSGLAHARVATEGRIAVSGAVTTVRVSGVVDVEVQGEARDDVAWTLVVDANATDDQAAGAAAAATRLQQDDLGDVLALSVKSSDDARQTGALTLRVPSGVGVRVESARRTIVAGTAGVRFENLVGDAEARAIAGLVDGAHRNGTLLVEGAGAVSLSLANSEAVLRGVRGATGIVARNGSTRLEQGTGPATIEVTNQNLTVIEPGGDVRISGSGGDVRVERPRAPIDIDLRRVGLTIDLDRAVPVTAFVVDARVSVSIDPAAPFALDMATEGGRIDAGAIGVAVAQRDGDDRLEHVIGNDARVAVRGERSSIVITPRK